MESRSSSGNILKPVFPNAETPGRNKCIPKYVWPTKIKSGRSQRLKQIHHNNETEAVLHGFSW